MAITVLFGLTLVATGCGSKSKKAKTTADLPVAGKPTVKRRAPVDKPVAVERSTGSSAASPTFGPIYFEFDAAILSADARATLDRLAEFLRKNPSAQVRIPGHTDERGTTEYNITLGEQRARVARDYLVRSGIAKARIQIISYGEEQPADPASGEDAWAKNRRDELELELGEGRSSR